MRFEPIPPRDTRYYGDPRDHGARCDLCPLKGSIFVPPVEPKGKHRLTIVGESPGRVEETQRRVFVGPTGQILDGELSDVGLSRDEAFLTNSCLCQPHTDKDAERAAECCAPRLLRELAAHDPSIPIIPMGKAAARSVLGIKSILLARGFVWTARNLEDRVQAAEKTWEKAEKGDKKAEAKLRLDTYVERNKLAGRTILPTLHPTFAFIHNETWAPIFHIDLDRAARWVRGELTADMLADKIERVTSLTALRKRKGVFYVTDDVEEIARAEKILGQEVGCDIETERMKPLSPLLAPTLTVQISDGDRTLVIAPWNPSKHAVALTRFLKGRTTVWHNGFCFDEIRLKADGVSFEGVQLEDTLTAHFAFASHLPQKLDHVVATFVDSSPWKIRHGVRGAEEKGLAPRSEDDGDLYLYGGTDAVLTIKAWRAMQADLAPVRAVYEHDKRRSLLYAQLQVNGYHVDRRRRRLLMKLLKARGAALKGLMRRIAKMPYLSPNKHADVRKALFGRLKAPMLNPTETGLASTSNSTLETLRTGDTSKKTKETRVARFAEATLNYRASMKSLGTYLTPVQIHKDGRAHYTFKPFGTITGRPAGRILSAPRWSSFLPERVREIYTVPKDCLILYFDLAQAEGRAAANISGDKNFIEACAKDLHTRNALILFPDEAEALKRDPKGKDCPRHSEGGRAGAACNCGKPYRDVTKHAGFAIIYQAVAQTVLAYLRSQGFPVELDQVEDMIEAMRAAYPDHAAWVEWLTAWVRQNGYIETAIMHRKITVGFHAKVQDLSNLPIQSLIADIMDIRLLDVINPQLPPGCKQILHHYDSASYEVPRRLIEWEEVKGKKYPRGKVVDIIENAWREPVRLKPSIVCSGEREFLLPAEVKTGRRWSEL